MLQDPDRPGRPRAARPLPAAALASLRDAFAGEVAVRLPRLQQLADPASTADPDRLTQALRDAHTLGSSAVVVGEAEASRCARALEADLAAHLSDGPAAQRPLPSSVPGHVQTLGMLLGPWLAA